MPNREMGYPESVFASQGETEVIIRSRWFGICATISLASVVGCNSGGPALAKVTGTVKFKGQPLNAATVTFIYPDGQMASGTSDQNGKFEMTTGGRDGAPIGTAKVTVSKAPEISGIDATKATPRDMSEMFQKKQEMMKKEAMSKKSEIPARYSNPDQSGFTANVQSGDKNDFTYELQE